MNPGSRLVPPPATGKGDTDRFLRSQVGQVTCDLAELVRGATEVDEARAGVAHELRGLRTAVIQGGSCRGLLRDSCAQTRRYEVLRYAGLHPIPTARRIAGDPGRASRIPVRMAHMIPLATMDNAAQPVAGEPIDSSPDLDDRYVDTEEASRILGFSASTLKSWRSRGEGPRFFKPGGSAVRYHLRDLHAFMRSGEEATVDAL